MTIPRPSYYAKELDVRLSRSYGPGRYDRQYEERGIDYPIGYVRWTEHRNLAAFVRLLADGRVVVADLITERIPVERARDGYEKLLRGELHPLGVILTYGSRSPTPTRKSAEPVGRRQSARPVVGIIGAGSFSQRVLIPGLRDAGFELGIVASGSGLSASAAAARFGFARAGTPQDVLESESLDLVCVASRHGTHATYSLQALDRDIPVFVEKPPALNGADLAKLREASRDRFLQVGFNRRFAPLAVAMRSHVMRTGQPVELIYRIAAGRLDPEHWLNDPDDGGGRLLGEGCHFVDFACWFIGGIPTQVATVSPGPPPVLGAQRFSVVLGFAEGSVATIAYGSEAAPSVPKECVEAHSQERSASLYDYRRLELKRGRRTKVARARERDKGHLAQLTALRHALAGGRVAGPDPLDTMQVTLRALDAAGDRVTPVQTPAEES